MVLVNDKSLNKIGTYEFILIKIDKWLNGENRKIFLMVDYN